MKECLERYLMLTSKKEYYIVVGSYVDSHMLIVSNIYESKADAEKREREIHEAKDNISQTWIFTRWIIEKKKTIQYGDSK